MVRDLINTNRIIGGIVGDIAGSVYEFDNYRVKDFTLFGDYHGHKCFATDDTIMTLAVCKAFIESTPTFENLDKNLVRYMQEVGRPYPDCGYGGRFMQWMYSPSSVQQLWKRSGNESERSSLCRKHAF